jgi:hypothetical protein
MSHGPHAALFPIIQFNKQHNTPTEHKTANLLAEKMFRNLNSSHLRQHIINYTFFAFYWVY